MKAFELLNDERKWTKRCFARNSKGNPCGVMDEDAQKFCAVGAIQKCYGFGQATTDLLIKCHSIADQKYGKNGGPGNLILVNELEDFGYRAIIEILKEADV